MTPRPTYVVIASVGGSTYRSPRVTSIRTARRIAAGWRGGYYSFVAIYRGHGTRPCPEAPGFTEDTDAAVAAWHREPGRRRWPRLDAR